MVIEFDAKSNPYTTYLKDKIRQQISHQNDEIFFAITYGNHMDPDSHS